MLGVRNKKRNKGGKKFATFVGIFGVMALVVKMWPSPSKESRQEVETERKEEIIYPTVFITKTGGKYHLDRQCKGLKKAKVVLVMTQKEAEEKGYTPCEIEEKQNLTVSE